MAPLAAQAQETLLEPAALEVGVELRLDVVGQGAACLGAQLESPALHPVLVGGMALVLAKTPAGKLRIASETDLLQLKTIARASRSLSTDEQDIAFLEARRQSARGEG